MITLISQAILSSLIPNPGNSTDNLSGNAGAPPIKNFAIDNLYTTGLGYLYAGLSAAAFIMLILATIKYIQAQGDAKKMDESKKSIISIILGIILITAMYGIIRFAISLGANVAQGVN
jgi:hypothetical protein